MTIRKNRVSGLISAPLSRLSFVLIIFAINFPFLNAQETLKDSDRDTVPDVFEEQLGLNPTRPDYLLGLSGSPCLTSNGKGICWGKKSRSASWQIDPEDNITSEIQAGASGLCYIAGAKEVKCQGSSTDGQMSEESYFAPGARHLFSSSSFGMCWISDLGLQCSRQTPDFLKNEIGEPLEVKEAGMICGRYSEVPQLRCWSDSERVALPEFSALTDFDVVNEVTLCAIDSNRLMCLRNGDVIWEKDAPEATELAVGSIRDENRFTTVCILVEGSIRCWAWQYAPIDDYVLPVPEADNPVQLKLGDSFGCFLDQSGVNCWDLDFSGLPLLNPQTEYPRSSRTIPQIGVISGISEDAYNSCHWNEKKVYCWGRFPFYLDLEDYLDTTLDESILKVRGECVLTTIRVLCGAYEGESFYHNAYDMRILDFPIETVHPYALDMTPGKDTLCVLDRRTGVVCGGWGKIELDKTNLPTDLRISLKNGDPNKGTICLLYDTKVSCVDVESRTETIVEGFSRPEMLRTDGNGGFCALEGSEIRCWGPASSLSKIFDLAPKDYDISRDYVFGPDLEPKNQFGCAVFDKGLECWGSEGANPPSFIPQTLNSEGLRHVSASYSLSVSSHNDYFFFGTRKYDAWKGSRSPGMGFSTLIDPDGDGISNYEDAFPFDESASRDSDGDGQPDDWNFQRSQVDSTSVPQLVLDLDDDNDGIPDEQDAFPRNALESLDSDGDGVGDNYDFDPFDASKILDSDSDGFDDLTDFWPFDSTEWLDSDGDGVGDNADQFPDNPFETKDSDGDGVGDSSDLAPQDESIKGLSVAGETPYFEANDFGNSTNSAIVLDLPANISASLVDRNDIDVYRFSISEPSALIMQGFFPDREFPYEVSVYDSSGLEISFPSRHSSSSAQGNLLIAQDSRVWGFAQSLAAGDYEIRVSAAAEANGGPFGIYNIVLATESVLPVIEETLLDSDSDGWTDSDELFFGSDRLDPTSFLEFKKVNEITTGFTVNDSTKVFFDTEGVRIIVFIPYSKGDGYENDAQVIYYQRQSSGQWQNTGSEEVARGVEMDVSRDLDKIVVRRDVGFWGNLVFLEWLEAEDKGSRVYTLPYHKLGGMSGTGDLMLLVDLENSFDFPEISRWPQGGSMISVSTQVRATRGKFDDVDGFIDFFSGQYFRYSSSLEQWIAVGPKLPYGEGDLLLSSSGLVALKDNGLFKRTSTMNPWGLNSSPRDFWDDTSLSANGSTAAFSSRRLNEYYGRVHVKRISGATEHAFEFASENKFKHFGTNNAVSGFGHLVVVPETGKISIFQLQCTGSCESALDGDGDGILDQFDAYPSNRGRFLPDRSVKDSDGDGFFDSIDGAPYDPNEISDQDLDGVGDFTDKFPNDPSESVDTDGDSVGDNSDAFPLDPEESRDTDSDGDGDNKDIDDDNDGYSDEQEAIDGTNPLSRFSCKQGCFSFDIDENGQAKALSDGLLVIRYLFGFSGDSLTSGATAAGGSRTSMDAISSYLGDAESELDIDGDGDSKALTDGLLLIRYLFGFSGDSLTSGSVGVDASRTTAGEISAYISKRLPSD